MEMEICFKNESYFISGNGQEEKKYIYVLWYNFYFTFKKNNSF